MVLLKRKRRGKKREKELIGVGGGEGGGEEEEEERMKGKKKGRRRRRKRRRGGGRKKNYNAGDSPNNCLEGSSDTLSPTLFTVLRTTRPISEYFGCLIEKSTFFVAFFPFYPHHHATSHVTCHHLLTAEMTSD